MSANHQQGGPVTEKKTSWLLDGKEEIREFLNGASDYKLKKWVNAGMPILIDGKGGWVAHAENIQEWFKAYTRRPANLIVE